MSPPRHAPNLNNPRDRWIAMPPEDRKIFQKNAERWMKMGPEERKVLREREQAYRARVKLEVDAALRDSGFRPPGGKTEKRGQKYLQERGLTEQAIRPTNPPTSRTQSSRG